LRFARRSATVPPACPNVNSASQSIVLVDDEKSYTELMSQMLAENLDCPVHAFTRPLDALRELPRLDPAVVITDYDMPQLNGIEFVRRASLLVPRASFVMITGHNLTCYEDQIAKLGALKGFLAKPFGWRKLADEIVRVWPEHGAAPASKADATSL